MKIIYKILGIVTIFTLFSFCQKTKLDNYKEIARFITEAADARMMDREEGKHAATKGTTQKIRDYGNLMIKDQTYLLEEIQKLASLKNITLSMKISDKKAIALEKLKEKTAEDLDKKFLNMIKIDHKRDVKEFKRATKYGDETVRKFAVKHLPMIEKHLSDVIQIKKNS